MIFALRTRAMPTVIRRVLFVTLALGITLPFG